jgi:hypothetical protein
MVYENHPDGCLPYKNGTAKNVRVYWSRKETGGTLPELAAPSSGFPPAPKTPPAPAAVIEDNESDEIDGMPSSCVYIHSPLAKTQFFNHNANAKDSKHEKYIIPDLLTPKG